MKVIMDPILVELSPFSMSQVLSSFMISGGISLMVYLRRKLKPEVKSSATL
jgi:prolipoprotein diacylglyceryltransferase